MPPTAVVKRFTHNNQPPRPVFAENRDEVAWDPDVPDGKFRMATQPYNTLTFATLAWYNPDNGGVGKKRFERSCWHARVDVETSRVWVCMSHLWWNVSKAKWVHDSKWTGADRFVSYLKDNEHLAGLTTMTVFDENRGQVIIRRGTPRDPGYAVLTLDSTLGDITDHLDDKLMKLWTGDMRAALRERTEVRVKANPATVDAQHYWDDGFTRGAIRIICLRDALEIRRMADFAQVKPGETVLEVACGNGDLGALIMSDMKQRHRWKVYFNDCGPECLSAARDNVISRMGAPPRAQSRFHGANVLVKQERHELKLSFDQPQGFDVVIARQFMGHFARESYPVVLDCLRDLVKPGGRIVVNIDMQQTHDLSFGSVFVPMPSAVLEVRHDIDPTRIQNVSRTCPTFRGSGHGPADLLGEHYLTKADYDDECRKVVDMVRDVSGLDESTVRHSHCVDTARFRDRTAWLDQTATPSGITKWRLEKGFPALQGTAWSQDARVRRDIVRSMAAHRCQPGVVGHSSPPGVLLKAVTNGNLYAIVREGHDTIVDRVEGEAPGQAD